MEEEKKKAAIIMKRFQKAKNKRREREEKWTELDAYDRNQQWDLENMPNWLPKPVTNFVHLVKYTKRAAFSVDNPVAKLRPVSPLNEEAIKKLNKAFEYTWERIKARKVVRDNIATAKLLGDAIAFVYWDEKAEGRMGTTVLGDEGYQFEGEIRVKEIDIANFYPDPDAFTIEDCRYIHVVERKPLKWVKKHPKFGKGWKEDEVNTNGNPEDRGEIYLRDYTTESEGMVDFHSHYTKEPNGEGGFTYKVTYLVGDKIVYEQPLTPNRYPFARLSDFKQRHSFWSMSTCEFILDNQRIINKVEAIITMIGTLMQNPQKVIDKNSGIDPAEMAMYGSMPGMTWESNINPSQSVYYIQPPNIPPVLFNMLENAKANIREITGLSEAYLGQSVGSLQTSQGVQALIERATLRDRDQMYDIELYIEDLSKLILDFMVTYYDTPRLIRVAGETPDSYTFEEFVGTQYANIDYDMFIDVSSKAPITRMRESQEAKDLLAMQGQYGGQFGTSLITPQEAIDKLDLVGKDKIIERMNIEELRNKTEEAMQVAQMMAEALAQGINPQEVLQMGTAMFQQIEEQSKGIGSTKNMNGFQMQQGAPSL